MKYSISLFKHKRDNKPQPAQRTWEEICRKIATPVVREEKDGPLFSPATFNPARRAKECVTKLSMLVLDYDHEASFNEDIQPWHERGYRFAAYTTHSHRRVTDSNPNAEDRFRVKIPLKEPIPKAHFSTLWRWAAKVSNGKIDEQAKDESRIFYTPVKASPDAPYEYHFADGDLLDWREIVSEDETDYRQNDSSNGHVYITWESLRSELGRRVISRGRQNSTGKWDARALCHNGKGQSGIFYDPATNRTICNVRCSEEKILLSEGLPSRPQNSGPDFRNDEENTETEISKAQWPDKPDETAFYGVAGELTRAIEPHTEADPVALLTQTLTCFGNIIGHTAYFAAESAQHFLNLFAVIVGSTSKGRKGSSFLQVQRLLSYVDEEWSKNKIVSGLASGEGLIWAVRDPIEKKEPIKDKGRIVDYQTVISDEGIDDKRILVIESEFAQTLKVAAREGNTLSAIIRQAWDSGNIRTLSKNSPTRATDSHISIVGHITKDELNRYLTTTEACNGFANRFLWICSRRSKVLPEGGNVDEINFSNFLLRLKKAQDFARSVQEIRRDESARSLWYEVYEELSEGKPGLLGAVTSRAEAQVMRLACIYALLDLSPVIARPHLEAALALWRYCEDSARFIFGNALGNPVADEILKALRQAGTDGMTRTDIRDLFKRNKSASEIEAALRSLIELGLAHFRQEESEGTNKKTERWFALKAPVKSSPVSYDINDFNDLKNDEVSRQTANVVDVVNVVDEDENFIVCPTDGSKGSRFTYCAKCGEFLR